MTQRNIRNTGTKRSKQVKQSKQRFKFISETISELKKVVWLSRREVAYLSALVIIVSLAMGLFLGFIDLGFTKLVNSVFLGGG